MLYITVSMKTGSDSRQNGIHIIVGCFIMRALLSHQIFIFKGLVLLYLSFVVWTRESEFSKKQDLESIIWLN